MHHPIVQIADKYDMGVHLVEILIDRNISDFLVLSRNPNCFQFVRSGEVRRVLVEYGTLRDDQSARTIVTVFSYLQFDLERF